MTAECGTSRLDSTPKAARPSRFSPLRTAADAAVALVLFVLATMTLASAPTSANPSVPAYTHFAPAAQRALADADDTPALVEIATTSSPQAADAVYRRTSATAAWILLSLSFSLLIAFNMAMLRHMRRAYSKRTVRPAL